MRNVDMKVWFGPHEAKSVVATVADEVSESGVLLELTTRIAEQSDDDWLVDRLTELAVLEQQRTEHDRGRHN